MSQLLLCFLLKVKKQIRLLVVLPFCPVFVFKMFFVLILCQYHGLRISFYFSFPVFIVDELKLVHPKTEFSDISDLPYQL